MKVKAYDLDYGINETLTYRIEPGMTMLSLFPNSLLLPFTKSFRIVLFRLKLIIKAIHR